MSLNMQNNLQLVYTHCQEIAIDIASIIKVLQEVFDCMLKHKIMNSIYRNYIIHTF